MNNNNTLSDMTPAESALQSLILKVLTHDETKRTGTKWHLAEQSVEFTLSRTDRGFNLARAGYAFPQRWNKLLGEYLGGSMGADGVTIIRTRCGGRKRVGTFSVRDDAGFRGAKEPCISGFAWSYSKGNRSFYMRSRISALGRVGPMDVALACELARLTASETLGKDSWDDICITWSLEEAAVFLPGCLPYLSYGPVNHLLEHEVLCRKWQNLFRNYMLAYKAGKQLYGQSRGAYRKIARLKKYPEAYYYF